METTIDRSSYRRATMKYERQRNQKRSFKSLIINETIVAMTILSGILSIKILEMDNAFEWIKNQMSSGISFEIISQKLFHKYNEDKFYIENINQNLKAGSIINIQLGEGENGIDSTIENKINKNDELKTEDESNNKETKNSEVTVNISEEAKKVLENFNIIPPISGTISSKFGHRDDPNPIVSEDHKGLDIAANTGTTIVAAHDGEVIEAGTIGTYGKCIMIKQGELTTVYAHCSSISVKKGSTIKQGEKIGEVGMTGNATGPHLHFEIRYNDKYVNPEEII